MKRIMIIVITMFVISHSLMANDFGAKAALEDSNYSLEDMLQYAIEDEYLALNEYEALVEKFGLSRPYTNIIESEKTHILYLKDLYKTYNIEVPNVNTSGHLYIPKSLTEAASIGVEAEILNISMYEKFLKEELPKDVRELFEFLKKASESHLSAFKKQLR